MKVINMRQTGSYVIYSVGLDQTPNKMWRVFFCDIEMEFNYSCMRMESFGIPCEHIVCVLVHEDIDELPRSLVLPRWTKTAKVGLQNVVEFHWDSLILSQYGCLMNWFRQLANFACQDNERFIFTREIDMNLLKQFKEEDAAQKELVNDVDSIRDDVQLNASGTRLATNDLGHSMPRDQENVGQKRVLHSPIKENINVDSVAWRATIKQLVMFVEAFHS
ncbi:Protein FAR1-RELATED SEQUENCE [Arachis hypogaea]|nr:Protein FAR1-RELATED SEQUENCE [Arachis hypogaea]